MAIDLNSINLDDLPAEVQALLVQMTRKIDSLTADQDPMRAELKIPNGYQLLAREVIDEQAYAVLVYDQDKSNPKPEDKNPTFVSCCVVAIAFNPVTHKCYLQRENGKLVTIENQSLTAAAAWAGDLRTRMAAVAANSLATYKGSTVAAQLVLARQNAEAEAAKTAEA